MYIDMCLRDCSAELRNVSQTRVARGCTGCTGVHGVHERANGAAQGGVQMALVRDEISQFLCQFIRFSGNFDTGNPSRHTEGWEETEPMTEIL